MAAELDATHREDLRAAALAGVLFLIFAAGACPTIYVGDSGELVTAVYLLGIPHPSGYPLYVLLGKLWTLLLPVGSIAYRMSLFSAACGAAACAVLYRLCRSLALYPIAALVAALLLAFAPSFWQEANVQRVYTLQALFVTLATATALRWHRQPALRWSALTFFLCGLGATNHTFMAIYAFAFGGFVAWTDLMHRWRPNPDDPVVEPSTNVFVTMLAGSGAFAVGLLPYLYLPIRARMHPTLDWGNPETLQGFLKVVTRRDFWERAYIEGPADLIPIALDYVHSLGTEFAWIGTALAVLGMATAWRRRFIVLPLLVMAGNLTAMALHGSRSDIFIWHRYYIPTYAMAALLAGLGCNLIVERLPARLRWLPLIIPAMLLIVGWPQADRSRYRIAEDFSDAVLRSLPPGAHLIATDDNILFVLIYLHLVEHRRPDVDLILQGVGDADLPPLRFNPDTEPLFFTHHPNWNMPSLAIVPRGVVLQAWRAGVPAPPPIPTVSHLDGEDDARVPRDYLTDNLVGHFHYMLGFTFEERDWIRARREFGLAAEAAPDNDVLFYNLGLIYSRNGLVEDAIAAFERSHAINPRHLASNKPADAARHLDELAAEEQRIQPLEAALANDPQLRTLVPGSPAYHRGLAEILDTRGESAAAHGHRLRALEIDAGVRS